MWKLYEIYILMYIKFWDTVVLIHLHIVYNYIQATVAELTSGSQSINYLLSSPL